jgi:hypothetical protein
MVRVITAGETPTGATAVLLEETFNGMGIYICPQHRDALRAWTTTH